MRLRSLRGSCSGLGLAGRAGVAGLALTLVLAAAACSSDDDAAPDRDDDFGLPAEPATLAEEPVPGNPELETPSPSEVDAGAPSDDDAGVVTSGGTCSAGGLYCGGDKVIGDAKTLYKCNGPGTPSVVEHCAAGCSVNAGRDDSCLSAPGSCAIVAVPKAAYLKSGLHPDASDALTYLKFTAARITQTIGSAAASAGTHAQDGVADGHAYSAATDLSILGMSDAQVATLLEQLTRVGFVPYYRKPGFDGWPASEARHVHVIWVGAPMKASLRAQVRDWHVGKNALASHTTYTFKTWSQCWRDSIWARYLTKNSATN